jgi:hypothetical protein
MRLQKEFILNRKEIITIIPEWDEIEKAQKILTQILKDVGFDQDTIDSQIMILSELIENAIKYSHFTSKFPEIKATIKVTKKNIIIEVKSPANEESNTHVIRLDKTIQWIRGYQNPFEAYILRLKKIAIKPLSDKDSGLGLVRIAYEGQSVVDFYINDENIISISSVYQI